MSRKHHTYEQRANIVSEFRTLGADRAARETIINKYGISKASLWAWNTEIPYEEFTAEDFHNFKKQIAVLEKERAQLMEAATLAQAREVEYAQSLQNEANRVNQYAAKASHLESENAILKNLIIQTLVEEQKCTLNQ